MAYECPLQSPCNQGLGDKNSIKNAKMVQEEKKIDLIKDMQRLSNKAANVLSEHAEVDKGDRVFIFMSRTPELYFALF